MIVHFQRPTLIAPEELIERILRPPVVRTALGNLCLIGLEKGKRVKYISKCNAIILG